MMRTQRVYRHGNWIAVAFSDLKVGDIARLYEPSGHAVPFPGPGGDGYSFHVLGIEQDTGLHGTPANPYQKGTS